LYFCELGGICIYVGSAVVSIMSKRQFRSGGVRTSLLTIMALLSGCCGLAYEVLYMRAMTTILGDMFYVHAALLSTFLVGIAFGAKVAHRFIRWLWLIEILTGLYALGFPIVSRWFSQQAVMIAVTSSSTLTILTTVFFLSVPGLLVGFSVPLFSAYIKIFAAERLAFQWIYKIYNLGALMSILGVELVLVRHFGVTLSLASIGAINLLTGVVLLLMRIMPVRRPSEKPRSFSRRIIVALALASLSSAVFQMFFLKLSYLVFHPHRENFAVGLSITMLGIFLGTSLVSKVRIRFETLLVLIPVLIGLIYVSYVPILKFYEATLSWSRSSELLIFTHKFAIGCIFGLGPMILFGATVPALMRTESEVAVESGHLLWISGLANAAGYLVYVLLGHPLLTTDTLLVLIAGVTLVASLLAAGLRWSRLQKSLVAGGIALMVLLLFQWDERNFYLAHWVNTFESGQDFGEDEMPRSKGEVTVFKSGAESATLVRSQEDEWITYNGYPSIYLKFDGNLNIAEIISGVIPALSAPRLDKALVLGLGTGMTAGATSRIFKATDVVEINNAFIKMISLLGHANMDIAQNPSAALHLADGRSFLVGKEGIYDAIINSIPAPTYFSASKIYTMEFYKRVVKALKPDGVFCTWLSAGNMSEAGLETVLSALRHNFRYCDLRIMREDYCMATCSNQPIRTRRFSQLPAQPILVKQLQNSLSGFDLDEFFEDIRVSDNIFDHFFPKVPQENTDDHPILEFMVVRDFQLGKMGSDSLLKRQALLNIHPVGQNDLNDAARLARKTGVFYKFGSGYFKQNFVPILKRNPYHMAVFLVWSAEYLADKSKPDEAIRLLKKACEITSYNYSESIDNLAAAYAAAGRFAEALATVEKALQQAESSGQINKTRHFQKQLQHYKSRAVEQE